MIKKVLIHIVLVLSVFSCSYAGKDLTSLSFDQLSVENHRSNQLMKNIHVGLSIPSPIEVKIWKAGDPHHVRTILSEKKLSRHQVPIIFLEPETKYEFYISALENGKEVISDTRYFVTKALPEDLKAPVNVAPNLEAFHFDGLILTALRDAPYIFMMNDSGKIVWYHRVPDVGVHCSSYNPETGIVTCLSGYNQNHQFCAYRIYALDLYQNILMNKECATLDYPLAHHDIHQLNDGSFALIRFQTRQFNLERWGGKSNQEVTADGFTVLSPEGKATKEWCVFDHISPEDDPSIMDTSGRGPAVEDWTHANSLIQDEQGDFYINLLRRRQVWKVSGRDGHVIYKLGEKGTLQIDQETFPFPFHAVSITKDGYLMLLDNGGKQHQCRAIAFDIDEQSKTARQVLNIPLPKEDFSRNQSSVYEIESDYLLFAASVPKTIQILDKKGSVKWKYAVGGMIFRAQYIPLKELKY